jgi:hypothetical protein
MTGRGAAGGRSSAAPTATNPVGGPHDAFADCKQLPAKPEQMTPAIPADHWRPSPKANEGQRHTRSCSHKRSMCGGLDRPVRGRRVVLLVDGAEAARVHSPEGGEEHASLTGDSSQLAERARDVTRGFLLDESAP